MDIGHCFILAQVSIPVTLIYTALFDTRTWVDFTFITISTLVLGALCGSSAYTSSLVRLYCGTFVTEVRKRPVKPIIIYDIENDHRCIPVRECLSIIDAPVLVYPVPNIDNDNAIIPGLPIKSRFLRDFLMRSGKDSLTLPSLDDPNTGVQLSGDVDDILMYLHVNYCKQGLYMDMQPPLKQKGGGATTAKWVQKLRSTQPYGLIAQPSLYNQHALRLYGHEGDSGCKLVREMLCSFQLHYQYVTCAQGGSGRVQLIMQVGRFVVPVLHDPATGIVSEGAHACLKYLRDVYGVEYGALGEIIKGSLTKRVDKLGLWERQGEHVTAVQEEAEEEDSADDCM